MTKETIDPYNSLVDAIHELDHKIRELESDIYNMRRDNDELRIRVSNLESSRSGIPF